MATSLPPAVVSQVNYIMDSQKPVNQQVDELCQLFIKHGFARHQAVKHNEMLVHPENRAKGMLNAHDVHQKGAQMIQVGMKRALLGEAMCVELSTKMDTRAQQLAKNANMVEQANGSLALIHGQESFLTHPKGVFIPREGCGLVSVVLASHSIYFHHVNTQGFLSLSCSHTTAFLRAIERGCHNPVGDKLDITKSDPCRDLIQNGWQWLVLSSQVEEAWPVLPGIFQCALNSSNAIAKAANELEVAATLAQFFQGGMTLNQALAKAKDGAIACQDSLDSIAYFVQHYAGGETCPLIAFLQRFSILPNALPTLLVSFFGVNV